MKKHLLIVALFCVGAIASKAQIVNPGFETWAPDPVGVNDPNSGSGPGWQTLNAFSSPFLGSSPVTVTEENTVVHSGSHSAKIVTAAFSATSYGYFKPYFPHDTAGVILAGTISGTSLKEGIPFNQHMTEFDFYYQYAPSGVDSASCSVVLSRTIGGKRNILAAGTMSISSTVASWTLGKVTMFWDSATVTPDTIVVLFSSSSLLSKPQVGSTMYVDDASVVLGVDNINAPTVNVNVYPSPATTEVNFQISSLSTPIIRADIYDITGQKVNSYGIRNNFLSMSTQGYAAGLYFYQLYDKNGSLLKSGKFSISGK